MVRKFAVLTITILAIVFLANTLIQAESLPLLTRHVRDVVVNGEAKSVGRLPATQSIHFDVVLALRDRAGLQNFLQEVNDPATPFYRQFITPEEFTARFGPSQEDWTPWLRSRKRMVLKSSAAPAMPWICGSSAR